MCFCLLRWIFYLCTISSLTHLAVCCACRWWQLWSSYQWADNESRNQIVGKLRWCKGLCRRAAASPLQSWSNWFWRAHVQGRKKKKWGGIKGKRFIATSQAPAAFWILPICPNSQIKSCDEEMHSSLTPSLPPSPLCLSSYLMTPRHSLYPSCLLCLYSSSE